MDPGFVKNYRRWPKQNGLRQPGYCSRVRLRRVLRALRQETQEYFHDTSLHGFKYITAPGLTFAERFIWILVSVLGIVFSVILMSLVWQRFQQNPTVTTIDTTTHPIWELAFPAVTICNFNKIYQPKADRLVKDLKMGLNNTQIDDFLISLPKLIRPEYINVDIAPGMQALTDLGYTVEELMQMLMQPCDNLLLKCAWLGQNYNCSKMFQIIKSIEGYCCAFNYHAVLSDLRTKPFVWWDELSYCYRLSMSHDASAPKTTTPSTTTASQLDWVPGVEEIQMVAGSGRDVGLTVVFDLEGELYGGATRPYVGASILIHDPEDYPEISLLSALAEPGKEIDIAITGTIIQSVENVRSLDIEQRQCWFDDEAKLGSSEQYSYQTCVTECRIDHIKRLCNCVPFYYPKLFPHVRICELDDVKCLRAYRRILSSLQTPIDMEAENRTVEEAECYCLPQCSDKWYSLVTETANVKQIKYDSPMLEYYSYGLDIRNLSLINVYFRDITCLKYRKDILLTWDGLFASFGGIFGLCLGGSVVSLVEFLYYYMVRIFHREKYPTTSHTTNREFTRPKLLSKSLKTTNKKLNDLDILRDSINFTSNNYGWSDVSTFATRIDSFRTSTRLKRNRLLYN